MVMLVIVCGLPGSGKTTAAVKISSRLPAYRLSSDDWLAELGLSIWDEESRVAIEALQGKVCSELLKLGVSVVVEWGTWSRAERDQLREQARSAGAAVELCLLDASDDELFHRIASRDREDPPIRREQISEWRQHFEVPDEDECTLFDRVYSEQAPS